MPWRNILAFMTKRDNKDFKLAAIIWDDIFSFSYFYTYSCCQYNRLKCLVMLNTNLALKNVKAFVYAKKKIGGLHFSNG